MKLMTTQQSLNVSGGAHGTTVGYESVTSFYSFVGMWAGAYTGFVMAPKPYGVPAALMGAFIGEIVGYVGSAAGYSVTPSILDATDSLLKPAPSKTINTPVTAV